MCTRMERMSSRIMQEAGSDDSEATMPPPRKIMRRGCRELEAAITEGEVILSLPKQDWNEWIANQWYKHDTDENDLESSHQMSDGGEDTNSKSGLQILQHNYSVDCKGRNKNSPRRDRKQPPQDDVSENQIVADRSSSIEQNSGPESRLPRFRDIIGHNAVKIRLDEVLLPLALPPLIADSILVGVRSLSASILLFGPPGCGKTQLAKAIAGEAEAAFLSIGPSDILSKFVGESEAAIRSCFDKAYDQACLVESKCAVLFFDEIDALGQSRGGAQQQQGVSTDPCSRRVLAELLIQLNRINTNHGSYNSRMETSSEDEGMTASCHIDEENFGSTEEYPTPSKENRVSVRVIIVAATNRPEDCDPALLRRFSVKVMVSLPSRRDRKKILLRFLADIDHTISTEQLDSLSLATEGWTGSDLESLTREAVMAPVRECIRCAALLKRRNARNRQRGGSSTCQVTKDDQEQTRDFSQEKILEQFTNLRSVSIQDFEDAIAFWAYNQGNTDMSNEIGPSTGSFDGQTIHYDSSSDEEE